MTTDTLLDLDPERNFCPADVHHIYLIGICGTAMAALAGMLKDKGFAVSGSDADVYPPMSDFLDRIGIAVHASYRAENLTPPPDLVIVGNVISKPNAEAQELARQRLPYLSLPQTLSRFFIEGKKSLVIAGTHGKTTTSSMLAAALHDAGGDPGFMIGGIVSQFNANYRIGDGPCYVTEGDEYDTAYFDKEAKFLHYRPDIAVITSLEFDHADIFDDLDQIKRMFRKFVRLLPEDGLIIANLEDENVADVVTEARCRVESYGLTEASQWRLASQDYEPGKSRFDLHYHGSCFTTLRIRQPGLYNGMNGAAVAAVMHHLGYNADTITRALYRFDGVRRRQEIRGVVNDITVIDDFAHHPTAVRETLSGLKKSYPDNRLIAVFEPRTNTSRRAIFQNEYAHAFQAADISLIREVAGDKPVDADDRFSSEQLAADLAKQGQDARAFGDTGLIIDHIQAIASPGDIVAVLSNGGFDNIHERLLDVLDRAN